MGAWGTALFSDDDAVDIRSRYLDLIGDGYKGREATEIVLSEWKSEQDNPVLWLALAATQWRCGRLEGRIRDRAIQIIDDGSDLERWREQGDAVQLRKRVAILEKLRKQLISTPPSETKVRKRYRSDCDWEEGELIAYRLQSGSGVIFQVLGLNSDMGGKWPVCEILDWAGDSIPDEYTLRRLPVRKCIQYEGSPSQVGIGRASKREYPADRISRLNLKISCRGTIVLPYTFCLWRYLDDFLAKGFGLR